MAVSELTGTGNGVLRSWTIPFPYIHASHVKMAVDGAPVDITVAGSTVTLGAEEATPTSENDWRIYRETPRSSLATYLPITLNDTETNRLANLQIIYIAQEVQDAVDKLETPGNVLLSEYMEDFLQVASEDAGNSYLGWSSFMRGHRTAEDLSGFLVSLGLSSPVRTLLGAANEAAMRTALGIDLKGYIQGLTYSNNGSDATNDIDVAAGGCMSDDGTTWISIAATTKQLDVAWAVDNGATPTGMLGPAAALGNNNYLLYAIKNPTTGATAVIAEKEDTALTLPTGYTKKRAFGWIKRSAAAIVAFKTYETAGGGLQLKWKTPTLDINLANTLSNARRTDPLKVPLTFPVLANFIITAYDAGAGFDAVISCPDETDAAPNYNAVPLTNLTASTTQVSSREFAIWTDATGKIAARVSPALNVDVYFGSTLGFQWSRR